MNQMMILKFSIINVNNSNNFEIFQTKVRRFKKINYLKIILETMNNSFLEKKYA